MTGNKHHRYHKVGVGKGGNQKKRFPKFKRQHKSLGGIPMKVVKGKVVYAQFVPHNYDKYEEDGEVRYDDEESRERKNATLPEGKGDFVRRHIYELRFGIEDETDDERRKREYREWWEKHDR